MPRDTLSLGPIRDTQRVEVPEPSESVEEKVAIVPKDKKIVKEGDKYYLVGVDTDITKMGPEAKQAANKAFLDAKSEMPSVKEVVNTNLGIEMKELNEKASNLNKKMSQRGNHVHMSMLSSTGTTQQQNLSSMSQITPFKTTPTPQQQEEKQTSSKLHLYKK
jgi:LidA long coiled-coil domain